MIAGAWTLAPSVTTPGLQEWQTMHSDGYTVSWRSLATRAEMMMSVVLTYSLKSGYSAPFLPNFELRCFSFRCGALYATRCVMKAMSSQEPGTAGILCSSPTLLMPIDETFSSWSARKNSCPYQELAVFMD